MKMVKINLDQKFVAEVGSNPAEPVLLQGYIPKGLRK